MTQPSAFDNLAKRPAAPPVLALLWALFAAQSAVAASVWAACLAVGLVAHRLGTRSAAPLAELPPPKEPPQPIRPLQQPRRRRTDAALPSGGMRPVTTESLLTSHRDNLIEQCSADSLANTAEYLSQDFQSRHQTLCVLHVGLDGFGPLVESYGREAAHQVLIQVARRLRHLARSEDKVLRLRDTEFVLLLGGPAEETKPFLFAMKARVIAELQRAFAYRTLSNLHINCSVGFAIHPLDGTTGQQLIHHAEESLAEARSRQVLSRQAQFA
ncbi:MAG TPA: GGDEF domain-containing protein [Rhizobacter sp.]|nr:GGDEF domain-containing protein [Rhizobacter sp.]